MLLRCCQWYSLYVHFQHSCSIFHCQELTFMLSVSAHPTWPGQLSELFEKWWLLANVCAGIQCSMKEHGVLAFSCMRGALLLINTHIFVSQVLGEDLSSDQQITPAKPIRKDKLLLLGYPSTFFFLPIEKHARYVRHYCKIMEVLSKHETWTKGVASRARNSRTQN